MGDNAKLFDVMIQNIIKSLLQPYTEISLKDPNFFITVKTVSQIGNNFVRLYWALS